jgi:hypothetical protein
MVAKALEGLKMVKTLSKDEYVSIYGILRTHWRQDVKTVTLSVLQRVERDPVIAPLLDSFRYASLHHSGHRFEAFDWQTTPQILLTDLVDEPRACISLKGERPSVQITLNLNCQSEVVKEKVDGKRRSVPKASDSSLADVSVSAEAFLDWAFVQAYLHLLGDIFEIINGQYGAAEHGAINHGDDFDRIHRDLLEPSFITWANLFGPELVARLGRERLLSAPAHQVWELPGGSIVLTVAASPLEQLEPEVQERIARVKAHLGILSPSERAAPEELAAFEARSAAAEAKMKGRIEEAFRQAREKTAAEMRRQAEGCVEGVRQFWGESLDFSPQSLEAVDRLIRTGFGHKADVETIATATQAFGAYVGEVVRRTLGGTWHDEEMKGQPVLLGVGRDSVRIEPFRAVSKRFEHSREREYALPIWYEQIRNRVKSH